MGTKDWSREWGGYHREGRSAREDEVALTDKLNEVFWCSVGQRRSTVWSRADPRDGINPIMAQMLDDATQDEYCGTPIGKGLSGPRLCAGP
jgi:hypothetical protein